MTRVEVTAIANMVRNIIGASNVSHQSGPSYDFEAACLEHIDQALIEMGEYAEVFLYEGKQ